MKKKARAKRKKKIRKKNAPLIKIYDLYIQKTDGFCIKYLDNKYIYFKQYLLFDLIKVKNLYPRFIFYEKYPLSELYISRQETYTIKNINKSISTDKKLKNQNEKNKIIENKNIDNKKN